jgi:hypothetical protein
VIALAFVGCERKADSAPPGLQVAQSKGDEFAVSASVEGTIRPGSEAALVARVEARKGFHINAEYPVNFRPQNNTDGVKFEKERYPLHESAERIPCGKGSEHACELRATVPFTALSPGEQRVAGILAFSVCTEEKCLIEKAPIEVLLSVR